RVGSADPQHPNGARFTISKDLHCVRGRRPVRNNPRFYIPDSCQVSDLCRIVPIAETWEVAVSSRLACVLGCRLPIHLEHTRTWLPNQSPDQIQIVNLDRSRSCLTGLIDSLQN